MPFTLTANVHDALAFNVAPDKLTLPDPATAVIVPPHVPVCPGGVATCNPAGSVSLNAIPVSVWPAFVLLTVKLNDVVPFSGTAAAPNVWLTVGGATTITVADAVAPGPLSFEDTTPVVLTSVPAARPVTLTLNVQESLPASAAPERLMLVSAGLAAIRPPPQLPLRPLGVETANPDGSASVKLMPLNELAFGFVMMKL